MADDNQGSPPRPSLQHLLLRALFEAGFHHRRRNIRQHSSRPAPTPAQPRDLRVADQEARNAGAVCRFCFEAGEGKLIAPCACSGSQEWVHIPCLRKWQKATMRAGHGHEAICSVCQTPYALKPPELPNSPVRSGMLLVAAPELGGTFKRAVILLCEVDGRGAHGVIINSPCESGIVPSEIAEAAKAVAPNMALHYRRGGPVCGGRLGVVSYAVVHNARTAPSVRSTPVVRPSTSSSASGAASSSAVHVVTDESGSPGAWSAMEVARMMTTLAQQAGHAERSAESSTAPPPAVALAFMGYCKWGRGQLQGEIARGSWALCEARCEDIVSSDVRRQWDELRRSDRIIAEPLEQEGDEDGVDEGEDGLV